MLKNFSKFEVQNSKLSRILSWVLSEVKSVEFGSFEVESFDVGSLEVGSFEVQSENRCRG
jgi:hypothetical protein